MSDLAVRTINRLREAPPLFKHVGGAAEYVRLVAPPVDKMPAAFVFPYSEEYGGNNLVNGVRQAGEEEIAVVLMVAVSPNVGAEVFDPLQVPRAALIGRLLGWQPDQDDGALLLASGHLLDAAPTHLSYQIQFKRDHTERAV